MDCDWQLQIQDCTGCGICFDVCDFDAIEMTRDMAYPEAVSGACTGAA
jgi:Pyruvate/2-oxoacid:ferredoxin oxidoreductase delta subunit